MIVPVTMKMKNNYQKPTNINLNKRYTKKILKNWMILNKNWKKICK